jgi:NAD(P)-dependent dehydrogenase (short-subunit alcohol dehydrogenase family)
MELVDAAPLAGLTALVTGASSGLGARFGEVLAAHGAQVVLAARRGDRLAQNVAAIQRDGGVAQAIAMDVRDEHAIASGFDAAESLFGPVHVLINNAGLNHEGAAMDLSVERFDEIFDVNVRGVFLCAREMARRARAHDIGARGRIVNISSIGAQRALPGLAAYCASKAAVSMMTQALAREWARHGPNVNAICPGYIETEINAEWLQQEGGRKMLQAFPRRRVIEIGALDQMIVFLSSPASAHVTGSLFTIDDGQSL